MYDCWHQDPEQRPSFSDLHKTITKMLEDAQVDDDKREVADSRTAGILIRDAAYLHCD